MDVKEYCKMTENRLYALIDIQARLANDFYMGLSSPDAEDHGSDAKTTIRTTKDRLQDLREVFMLEDALESIVEDPYYPVIWERYVRGKTDEQIAEKLYCEVTTIWRNRTRLLKKMAVRLYGVVAANSA